MLPGAGMESTNVRGPDVPPDADLIAACDEFLRIHREFEAYFDALSDDMDADDARGSAILDPMPKLVEQIVSLRHDGGGSSGSRPMHGLPLVAAGNGMSGPSRARARGPVPSCRAAGLGGHGAGW